MARTVDGVLVVNPGAIASGNYFTRQLRQTVAVMTGGKEFAVQHVDLAAPEDVYEPWLDWHAGFDAALRHYQGTILASELNAALDGLRPDALQNVPALMKAVSPLAHSCWDGEREFVTVEEFRREVLEAEGLAEADRALLRKLLEVKSI